MSAEVATPAVGCHLEPKSVTRRRLRSCPKSGMTPTGGAQECESVLNIETASSWILTDDRPRKPALQWAAGPKSRENERRWSGDVGLRYDRWLRPFRRRQ